MISWELARISKVARFSTSVPACSKVAIIGASGGIGQPLSLLLKLSPLVSGLSLNDLCMTPGVTADLSHVNTIPEVKGFDGKDSLDKVLKGMDVVVVVAGTASKSMEVDQDDLFNTNAILIRDIAEACAKHCPKALIAIATNPLNSTVPIAAEVLKKNSVFDPRRVFGVTTLDSIRSSAFVGRLKGIDPQRMIVPVIGGHSRETIIPVLSQTAPKVKLTEKEVLDLTKKIRDAAPEVIRTKAGAGSATLSTAYAAARFTTSLIRGLNGEKNVVECSYVASDVTEASYFSTPLILGRNGVNKNLGLPPLSDYEKQLMKIAIEEIKKSVKKGEDFVKKG